MIKYQAKVFKDVKRYSVIFPDLPGCFSDGDTKKEALEHAREALSLHLEEARDPKWSLPKAKKRQGKQYQWVVPYEDVAVPLMIRQARLKHNLTQKELAKRVGITIQQLQKLETPGKSNPTIKTLAQISEALEEQLEVRLVA
jgi:antitoxin HicB